MAPPGCILQLSTSHSDQPRFRVRRTAGKRPLPESRFSYGGGKWFVVIKNGELEIGRGEKENPDVTFHAAAKDYVEIAEGRMNSMLALATGKFKIKGHMGLAMKLQKVFKY
jgi:putative sterol carrier protein